MNKTDRHINENKNVKRSEDQKAATRKLTSRIVLGVGVALVLIFVVFIFVTTNFMGDDSIVTEVTNKDSIYNTINTTGFVIRSEDCIKNSANGVLVYQVDNGEKVTADGVIATVYKDESDVVDFQRICDIEEEIGELTELNNALSSANVGLDSVNNRLDQKLTSFIQNVNNRDFNNISVVTGDLLTAIYRKQLITGEQDNFDEKIEELKQEKDSLENRSKDSIGEIKTKNSGYFVTTIDGFEKSFNVQKLSQIKYSDIKGAKPAKVDDNKYIGKVIKGVNWYLACPITEEEAVAIKHNSSKISVKIPYANNESIPAKVVSVNQFSNEEKALVILECNYMNSALAQIRNEAVEVELNSYEGLKVSKKALHDDYVTVKTTDENGNETTEETKVQGVYVKYGNELIFKQVYIIYSGEDYVICSEDPGDDLLVNGTTLELYDEVVIEGDDLYDGKIID